MVSEHFKPFAEFCASELATGGPDPQIALIAHLAKDASPIEKVWLAGCYGAHHCVPSAYAVWQHWRPEQAADPIFAGVNTLEAWLRDHWAALPVRPEMRSHRMPVKRARCLADFARYAIQESWHDMTYDELWNDSQQQVKFYGRYMAIKYVEMLRHLLSNPKLQSYDMRARHAWSPRKTLAQLHPDTAWIIGDRSNNSDSAVTLAEAAATATRDALQESGVTVSYFQLQVMLCEYKEYLADGYYPGASHDEEMDFIDQVAEQFDMGGIWEARKALFPEEQLGEISGWRGLRRKDK